MSRDQAEVEREFIEGLAEDTGRDLAAWMALIDGQSFAHRNDMIDWLRQQGLTFAKASRLERIHHNGGKPLYGDKPVPIKPVSTPAPPAPRQKPGPETLPPAPAPPIAPVAAPLPAPLTGDLAAFLARAKGYRPLAELLMRAIREAVPATTVSVHETHADLAAPRLYGAIAVTAKDVRLVLDLGEHPFEGDLKRLRLPGTQPALTHGLVLSDARRIDAALRELVAAAARRANS